MKDMDRLKDYIEQHREAFDEVPLPEGHLERFAARLEQEEEKKVKTVPLWRRLMPLAAAGALFLCFRSGYSGKGPIRMFVSSIRR